MEHKLRELLDFVTVHVFAEVTNGIYIYIYIFEQTTTDATK